MEKEQLNCKEIKKEFKKPEIEITELNEGDVIVTSLLPVDPIDNELE